MVKIKGGMETGGKCEGEHDVEVEIALVIGVYAVGCPSLLYLQGTVCSLYRVR